MRMTMASLEPLHPSCPGEPVQVPNHPQMEKMLSEQAALHLTCSQK